MSLAAIDPNPTHRFVFDGQSHNQTVIPSSARDLVERAMGNRMVPFARIAAGGRSLTTNISLLTSLLTPYIGKSTNLHYSIIGGTQDVVDGDSAAQIYSDMSDLADDARTLGVDTVIASTIPDAVPFTGPQQTVRAAANVLILADAGSKFDYVWDFSDAVGSAVAPNFDPDEVGGAVHLTEIGAITAGAVLSPIITTILAL